MKASEYELLKLAVLFAVEDGIAIGYNSAHKHMETITEEMLKDCIHREVMSQICEWFDFEDESREVW